MSWALAASHLGMLDAQRSLGTPNAITLVRSNLPADGGSARWLPALALGTDLVDGRLARRMGVETAFGGHAGFDGRRGGLDLVHVAHEPSRTLRIAALAAWAAPMVLVTVASIAGGCMVDAFRLVLVRPGCVDASRRRRAGAAAIGSGGGFAGGVQQCLAEGA